MKVYLHTRTGQENWKNVEHELARLPAVGECVAFETSSPWYEVRLVVHMLFAAEFEAEVYAVEVDSIEAIKQAGDDT